jgi:ankyrin repeat protein
MNVSKRTRRELLLLFAGSRVHEAVINDDVVAIASHVELNRAVLDLVHPSVRGHTPLSLAVALNREAAIKQLLAVGASVTSTLSFEFNGSWSQRATVLHIAAHCCTVPIVALLDRAGASLHALDWLRRTVCHYAAENADERVMMWFTAAGANCRAVNSMGESPAMVAASNVNHAVLAHLAERDAPLAILNNDRKTICHVAAANPNEKVMTILLAKRVPCDLADMRGVTPLMIAATNANAAIFRMLVDAGANIQRCDDMDNSIVHFGARNSDPFVLSMAIAAGCAIDRPNANQMTPCHIAASNPSEAVMAAILAAKVRLEVETETATPLLLAASNPNERVFALLLEAGANADVCNRDGGTVCTVAARNPNPKVLQLAAAAAPELVSNVDFFGYSPAHWVASSGNMAALQVLIDVGIESLLELHTLDDGESVVHLAAAAQKPGVLRYLISQGADLRLCDSSGRTLCHWASAENLPTLFGAGADLNRVDNDGNAPIHRAAKVVSIDLVTMFAAAADVDVPVRSFVGERRHDVEALLIAGGAKSPHLSAPPNMIEWAMVNVAASQLKLLRERGFVVCAAMQELALPALLLCEILLNAFAPRECIVSFHFVWRIATAVKHFR